MISTLLLFAAVLVIVIGSAQSRVPFPTKFRDFLRSPLPIVALDVEIVPGHRGNVYNTAAVRARLNARPGR